MKAKLKQYSLIEVSVTVNNTEVSLKLIPWLFVEKRKLDVTSSARCV